MEGFFYQSLGCVDKGSADMKRGLFADAMVWYPPNIPCSDVVV